MDDAFDTFRNQRVWSAVATNSRFPGHFICPLCRTEVALASGPFVRKHFRHLRDTEHAECERYSKNFGREVPLSCHEYEHLDAVLVARLTHLNGGDTVSIAIRFRPHKRNSVERFTGDIDLVAGTKVTRYTFQPTLRQQFFRVTEPESGYLIKAKMECGGDALFPIDGFDEDAAVFRVTEGESTRLAKHRTLTPGDHIVICRKLDVDRFHPLLEARTLTTIPGLNAALIRIPEHPTMSIRENIRSLLKFLIADKVATYGFICPTKALELAPDCWEITKDAELAISIRLNRGRPSQYSRLLVQKRVMGHLTTDYLSWDADCHQFVVQLKSGTVKPDVLRIGLATEVQSSACFLLEINFAEYSVEPQCARIQFTFESRDGARFNLKWSAHALPRLLTDVGRGGAKLVGIRRIPKIVAIKISDTRGQHVELKHPEAAETLMSFLRHALFPCVLSASGHTSLFLDRRACISESLVEKSETIGGNPRCRYDARLRDAYRRGYVSKYTVSAQCYE